MQKDLRRVDLETLKDSDLEERFGKIVEASGTYTYKNCFDVSITTITGYRLCATVWKNSDAYKYDPDSCDWDEHHGYADMTQLKILETPEQFKKRQQEEKEKQRVRGLDINDRYCNPNIHSFHVIVPDDELKQLPLNTVLRVKGGIGSSQIVDVKLVKRIMDSSNSSCLYKVWYKRG